MMRKKIHIAILILCILFLAIYLMRSNHEYRTSPDTGYTIPRTLRYGFTILNTGNTPIKIGIFKTYAPVKKTAFQTCRHIAASHPFTIENDMYGNQLMIFKLEPMPPYGSRIITITAELLLSVTPNSTPENNPDIWLQSETYIESDQKDIIATADSLISRTLTETEANILNFVADHITYSGYVKNPRGALYAFTQKKGDCTEYMYLFTALSRAAGIPARGIGGYIVAENAVLNPVAYHNWSEFYDNGRWQVADPQNRVFMKNSDTYIAMRIIPPLNESNESKEISFNRFHVEGQGLTARMNE